MSNQSKGRPGGVLPISAVATKKPNATQKSAQRSPAPRLRLIIRRLAPGLTEGEFWDALGSEWQTGNGKVDWHAFQEGKISKDPSKPSRPGRAYLKVKDQSLLEALSAKVKVTSFKDAKNTGTDPCLVGPPSLEFAPYSKVPSGRSRHDGRQGTIDQDSEFIDFLQSLTEPITKPITNGSDITDLKQEKAVTTPLVQFIKEKKANKAKEKEAAVAAAKSSKKKDDAKEGKSKSEPRPTIVVKSNVTASEKTRLAKATQDAVKAANKTAAQIQNKTTANKAEQKTTKETNPSSGSTSAAAQSPLAKPERQRGSASAASRMIARDLGLAPKEPRTPRAARNVSTATTSTAEAITKTEPQQKSAASTPAPTPKQNISAASLPQVSTPPTGPRNNKSSQTPQAKPAQASQPASQRPNKLSTQPAAGAKSAFLKHANPSQGITEDLLRTIFSEFGEVIRCEIDKKKGLGYVDFTETEALKKAMMASPVKIANGQVVVLENRSPYHKRQSQPANAATQQAAPTTTRSRAPSVTSSTAVSAVTSPQPTTAVIATSQPAAAVHTTTAGNTSEETSRTETVASTTNPASSAAPTAPKSARGGSGPARNARGGAGFSTNRAGFNQSPNRGRGGFRARGGRGGKAGANTGAATGSGSMPQTPAQVSNSNSTNEAANPPAEDKA